ncbi:MAG: MlaD family protein [Kofleriaceae bacterium]
MSLLAQDERLTRRVGAVTLVLLVGTILFFVFLLDRLDLGSPVRIQVYFAHSGSLRAHAPLIVAGQPVGRIESIDPVPHGAQTPLNGELGSVARVAIKRKHTWRVPRNAEIFVSSHGPLSERYLEVAPPKDVPGPPVRDGEQFRGADPPSLDSVLSHTWGNMNTFRAFIAEIDPELDALIRELKRLAAQLDSSAPDAATAPSLARIRSLAGDVDALVTELRVTTDESLGGPVGLAHIAATIKHTRGTIAQARAMFDRLAPKMTAMGDELTRVGGHIAAHDPVAKVQATIALVQETLAKIDPVLAAMDEVMDRFANGEGTIGRLMNDPEFPEDAKDLGKIIKRQPWRVIARPKQ